MNNIEVLGKKFGSHISLPWASQLSSEERTIFLVYPKENESRLTAKIDLFRQAAESGGRKWRELSLVDSFGEWMASQDYAEDYYEFPEDLNSKLESDFTSFVARKISETLRLVDDTTVVGLTGVSSLFGFAHLSAVLAQLEVTVPGRLTVFFPGSHEKNLYRLLDGRESWDYLAFPITLHESSTL